ncbi:MAG: MBL fold metallo-hydrolase [Spirochaetaceae bacterium]|jgi:glyoxylase-like metal-dependent hydrolase (beta-lactamase superfamily II)|nr:MBL fold metallo-hydrolase [Spirochaetaceae bacterium]
MQIHEKIVVGDLEANCWIVPLRDSPRSDGPSPAAVIDPGADAPDIIRCLERRKLYPKCILLTHGHFDHIAALPELYSHYSGKDRKPLVAIGREDLMYVGPASLAAHREAFTVAAGNSYYIDQLWRPMPEADRVLDEGDSIEIFTVLHLPGHTQGSVAFFDEKNKRLYTGDTLFRAGIGRTDLPGGDWTAMQGSLSRLFQMNGDIKVYPGHGDATSIAREAQSY